MDKNEFCGYLILKNDTIKEVSRDFEYISGYTKHELIGKNIFRFFDFPGYNKTKNKHYYNVELKTKNGRIKVLAISFKSNGDTDTVYIKDITKEKIYNIFYKMLSTVNKAIISVSTTRNLFNEIATNLSKFKYVNLVWVAYIKDNKAELINYAGKSKYTEYSLDALKDILTTKKTSPMLQAVQTNQITINSYTPDNKNVSEWQNEMLKFNYLSSCYIPIDLKNEKYLVSMYSNIPFFFDEYILPVLEEMKDDMIFCLKNMEQMFYKDVFFRALQNSRDWVLLTDAEGKIIYVNEAVEILSGYSRSELIGEKPSIFKSGKYDDAFYKTLWDTISIGKIYRNIIINKHKNSSYYQLYHTIVPIVVKGTITHYVAVSKDISREMHLEEEVRKFRYYDTLTGILNSKGFELEAEKILNKLEDSMHVSVAIVDIYNFSNLNNIYGLKTCDRLLKQIALSLTDKGLLVGRLGDDEFVILNLYNNISKLENTIENILNMFSKPFLVDDESIDVNINIGISTGNKRISAGEIISHASSALSSAKKKGKNTFVFYKETLNKLIHEEFYIEQLILESLQKELFTFYLQPIYSGNIIVEFEALVRIMHPKEGIIMPDKFIKILENSPYLEEFERYLIKSIERQLITMKKKANRLIPIGINLSMNNLVSGKTLNILKDVNNEFVKHINIEITERIFSKNIKKAKDTLQMIRDMGFCIMIDDFGTGYSSLNYMHNLPIDAIKIDISFVKKMLYDKKVELIVKTIIDLSKGLSLKTVAEGVETQKELDILTNFGCDYIQGYYFSKPLPFEEAISLL